MPSRNLSWVTSAFSILLAAATPAWAQFVPNRYTLLLEDPPVSSRFAAREEMRTQAAQAYRQQIETKQAAMLRNLASRSIAVTGSVTEVLNAIFVNAPADRVAELEALPGVIGVRPMRRFQLALNKATQLMNAPAAWSALGGAASAGKGIKIAIIDSGIDQTHPAFQDSSLSALPNFPKCTDGHPEDCAFTNSKVIVARSYVRQLGAGTDPKNPAADSVPDDYSPRDRDGHGTAVASCAAGNTATGSVTFSGMAPKAYLGNYKVSGSPGVLDGSVDGILILAINDALKDGMDIASLSVVGPAFTGALDTGAACGLTGNAACDPLATAYENAVKAGMVVVVAAGNDGYSGTQYPNSPTYGGVSSPANAPSVIGVGATINSHVLGATVSLDAAGAPASLKGIAAQMGDSAAPALSNNPTYSAYQVVFPAQSAPLIDVTQIGNDGFGCAAFPAFSLSGAYALIQRGPGPVGGTAACSFSTKASNAGDAGALGVIFYMSDSSATTHPEGIGFSSSTYTFFGPTVMLSLSDGQALKAYIDSHPGQTATINLAGSEQDLAAYSQIAGRTLTANMLANYSSRGPAPDGIIKPDMVAVSGLETDSSNFGPDSNDSDLQVPGGIYTAAQRFDPNGGLYSANGFTGIGGGTSFSAPIVAGAAALVKQAHPGWSPPQIKSALVNSAAQDTATDTFGDAVDVASVGAGRLDAGAAMKATLTAEPSTISFGFLKAGGLPLTKTITITNKGASSVTLAVAVSTGKSATGASVAVDNPSLTLAGGASGIIKVTLSGNVPAAGQFNGAVTVSGSGVQSVRLPYMFVVGNNTAYNLRWFAGFSGLSGQDLGGFPVVQVTDQFGAPVVGSPVSLSVSPRGAVTFKSVPGVPACSPDNSTTVTTCNTDNYGFAWVDVVLGNPGSPTITLKAATGASNPVSAFIGTQPTITAAGVVNDATFKAPIAAGSYVAIFGTNLLDTNFLSNSLGDAGISTADGTLPLVIDGTTVSFDVPSAGISVPGHLTFATDGQVNVQVPWELQGQSSVKVKVSIDDAGFLGNVVDVPLAPYTPAFFLGNGVIAAEDAQTGAVILSTNPAKPGEIVSLFMNGLGPVNNQPPSGGPAPGGPNLANTKVTPTVNIGGQQAQVLFSGLAPGFAGLYQVNVTVPSGLTGNQQVTVSIGGVTSPAATLPVK